MEETGWSRALLSVWQCRTGYKWLNNHRQYASVCLKERCDQLLPTEWRTLQLMTRFMPIIEFVFKIQDRLTHRAWFCIFLLYLCIFSVCVLCSVPVQCSGYSFATGWLGSKYKTQWTASATWMCFIILCCPICQCGSYEERHFMLGTARQHIAFPVPCVNWQLCWVVGGLGVEGLLVGGLGFEGLLVGGLGVEWQTELQPRCLLRGAKHVVYRPKTMPSNELEQLPNVFALPV